jgi:hypothetical protein
MFILIDKANEDRLVPVYEHVNELDDKNIFDLSESDFYTPDGDFHIVDVISEPDKLSRWKQLYLASLGARVYSDSLDENSPIWAGSVPEDDKLRRVSVDASFADGRASYFADFKINYIGRTNLDPRNIFVLDNKKGNRLHDPSKDETLEALYASLPDEWWGSCAFVSTGNVDRLGAFLESQPEVIPLTFTTGGSAKLKSFDRPFVTVGAPTGKTEYGIEVRNLSNRLSYDLSRPEIEPPVVETGFKYNI